MIKILVFSLGKYDIENEFWEVRLVDLRMVGRSIFVWVFFFNEGIVV